MQPAKQKRAVHPAVARARGRLGGFTRVDAGNDQLREDARRELAAANIEAYIEKTLAEAPPLTTEQRTKLAELLAPARESVTKRANTSRRSA